MTMLPQELKDEFAAIKERQMQALQSIHWSWWFETIGWEYFGLFQKFMTLLDKTTPFSEVKAPIEINDALGVKLLTQTGLKIGLGGLNGEHIDEINDLATRIETAFAENTDDFPELVEIPTLFPLHSVKDLSLACAAIITDPENHHHLHQLHDFDLIEEIKESLKRRSDVL
ncbi:hypothetical protein KKF34_19690 [Myxococcota bacterium]|nr:hypothetical protein [Myxococcota bacterium]MBU1380247.1 hypothetical protein [Myxococcota bacterium]MBU1499113.1 hypothetical protein [Myxococcota bacterium]